MWSQRTRYAVRTLIHLASHLHRRTPARELAATNGVPGKYLEAILADLRAAGIVSSTKGPGGGYQLAADPSRIRLIDVIRVVDPDLVSGARPDRPKSGGGAGSSGPPGPSGAASSEGAILSEIGTAFLRQVEQTTIADALARWQRDQATMNYVI